jgi:hypothetical protein
MSKTYAGSCHCGGVRYEVAADLSSAVTCNCSICAKTGTVLTFVPASAFKLLQGGELLTDYQFNRKVIHHLFCKRCGIRSFARGRMPDGTETVAVNVRCLEGVDVTTLEHQPFDGRSL